MTDAEWEITFNGKNTKAIQALVGRMQNMDGDIDTPRFGKWWGRYQVWIEDAPSRFTGDMTGGWVDVEVGDSISKIGSMRVPKYGESPVFRVTKGKTNDGV